MRPDNARPLRWMNGFDPGARNGRSHCQSPTLGYVLLAFQAVTCAKFRYAPSNPSRQIVPGDVQLVRVYIGARSNQGGERPEGPRERSPGFSLDNPKNVPGL